MMIEIFKSGDQYTFIGTGPPLHRVEIDRKHELDYQADRLLIPPIAEPFKASETLLAAMSGMFGLSVRSLSVEGRPRAAPESPAGPPARTKRKGK